MYGERHRNRPVPKWAQVRPQRAGVQIPRKALTTAYRSQNMLTFRRSCNLSPIVNSAAGEQLYAWSFQLSDLPNYTELTSLFDSYRFNWVKCSFMPQIQNTLLTTNYGDPSVHTAIDYDSATSGSVATLQEKDTYRKFNGLRPFQVFIKAPRCASAVYSGAFTSYGEGPRWIDCSSPSVQHYGMILTLPQTTGSTCSWYVTFTYSITCRNTR